MKRLHVSLLRLAMVSVIVCSIPALNRADELDEAFRKLQRQASAESAAARREAARQLTIFFYHDEAFPTLVKLLGDKDAGVRLAAAEGVRTACPMPALGPVSGNPGEGPPRGGGRVQRV